MSPDSEGGSETEQFHPNMIHLLRKQEDGKDRIPTKEPVPNIDHWQLELMLKTEDESFNLYVVNKTSKKDENRNIEPTDLLFSVGPDKVIKLGKEKRNLHLTILHPKTEARAKGDEVSLDKIVKARIQDQARAEAQKRFQGKNSKNLKKVQLRCEVFDLRTDTLIDSAISEVIRDKQSKDYGSLELKEVRPRGSCCEGGGDIMVVTEHSVKKGTVVPVFQLFDAHGKRSEVEEKFEQFWLKQPQLEEPQDDDRIIKFLSPKQENYEMWSHLTLKLKLRRKDDSDISESTSSCDFKYRPHNSFQFPILDLHRGESSFACVDCNFGFLDGGETELSRAAIPQHSGPGLKRRIMSSNPNRNPLQINDSQTPVIDSVHVSLSPAPVPVMMEDTEMLQRDGETSASARYLPLMDDEHFNSTSDLVNLRDILPPRSAIEFENAALFQPSRPGLKRRKMSSTDNRDQIYIGTGDSPSMVINTVVEQPPELANEKLVELTRQRVNSMSNSIISSITGISQCSPSSSLLTTAVFNLMILGILFIFLYYSFLKWMSFILIIYFDGPIIYQNLRELRLLKNVNNLLLLFLLCYCVSFDINLYNFFIYIAFYIIINISLYFYIWCDLILFGFRPNVFW